MKPHIIQHFADEEYLGIVNQLLRSASAIGGLAMGYVSVAAWNDGLTPNNDLLRGACRATSLKGAAVLYEIWKERQTQAKVGAR